jgi:hypothetical protein
LEVRAGWKAHLQSPSFGEHLSSTQVVVGLFVAFGFDGFGLIIGIEDHFGKSTDITVFAPPSGSKHRV